MPRTGGARWLLLLPALVLLVAGLACWTAPVDSDRHATDVLIVGDQRGGAQALLQAAGELDDVPYRIEWALFPAASPLLEALDAGAVDMGGIGGAPFAYAYASGARVKAVTASRPSGEKAGRASAIVVAAKAPLQTIHDLKGKRVATIRGSAGQDLVLKLLERAGIDPGEIRWVYLANGEAKAALAAGAVDAWSTWGSYVAIAVLRDGDRILADGADMLPGAGFYAASDGAIANKRALIADYIGRYSRARAWARRNPMQYAKVLAHETGIPLDVARFTVEAGLGSAIPIDRALIAEQQRIFDRYQAVGIIPRLPDLARAYDQSFNAAVFQAGR